MEDYMFNSDTWVVPLPLNWTQINKGIYCDKHTLYVKTGNIESVVNT